MIAAMAYLLSAVLIVRFYVLYRKTQPILPAVEVLLSSYDKNNETHTSAVTAVAVPTYLQMNKPRFNTSAVTNTQGRNMGDLLRKRRNPMDDTKLENDCTKQKRKTVIDRAREWQDDKVQYVSHNFHKGYRTQCSGFVLYAWDVPLRDPNDTPRCYQFEELGLAIARTIQKDQLTMGDAMVCNHKKYRVANLERGHQDGGHCLIFERWTNDSLTAFVGWELCADATCTDVTRREIPYPYFYKTNCWEPMRYSNITCVS